MLNRIKTNLLALYDESVNRFLTFFCVLLYYFIFHLINKIRSRTTKKKKKTKETFKVVEGNFNGNFRFSP